MTTARTLKNIKKSVINAANLNGLGAVSLSLGLGSAAGSLLFAFAMIWGTCNKYRSLTHFAEPDTAGNRQMRLLLRLAGDPSVTATILMIAAFWNLADAACDLATQGRELIPANAARTAAWLCGVLGDNALRKLDRRNFGPPPAPGIQGHSGLRAGWDAAAANPALFYLGSGIAFTAAMLPGHPLASPPGIAGAAIIIVMAAGIAHALRRTMAATAGKIPIAAINDGIVNYSCMAGNMGIAILAVVTGHPAVACAETLFSLSALSALYETRSALGKAGQTMPQRETAPLRRRP